MKRKAPVSQDESSKRRKQESVDISEDNAQVRSIQAELSVLKSREIADISHSVGTLPHMTFGKRPIKLKTKSAASTKPTITSSLSYTTPPTPLSDATLKSKQKQVESQKALARRSSFGQRGKRAKGSFEQGESVMPHESVSSDKLYRHIDMELPEPHRARHLLIWCARRTALPVQTATEGMKGKGKGEAAGRPAGRLNDADSALLASVQDKIVRQLMDLTIDIPLYDISSGPFAKVKPSGKKEELAEDPVNARNKEVKERLAKAEERARDEDAMWSKVIQDYNSLQSTVLSTLPIDNPSTTATHSDATKSRPASMRSSKPQIFDVRLSELDEKWRQVDDELESYRRESSRSTLDKELARRCKGLPFQLDSIRQSLARSTAFTEQAKEFIDHLFRSIEVQAQPLSLPPLGMGEGGKGKQALPGLFAALSLSSSGGRHPGNGIALPAVPGAPGGDSVDLFKALAKNDVKSYGSGGGDVPVEGGGGGGEVGGVTTVQPSTPRRMPGTPRRGGADNIGAVGGGGGSALRRG